MDNYPFVGNVQNLSNFTQGYPMLDHVNCSTPDLAEETARKLATLLPECAGEVEIEAVNFSAPSTGWRGGRPAKGILRSFRQAIMQISNRT